MDHETVEVDKCENIKSLKILEWEVAEEIPASSTMFIFVKT